MDDDFPVHLERADVSVSAAHAGTVYAYRATAGDGSAATGQAQLRWEVGCAGAEAPDLRWAVREARSSHGGLEVAGYSGEVEVLVTVVLEGERGCSWTTTLRNHGAVPVDSLSWVLESPRLPERDLRVTFPFGGGWAVPLNAVGPEPITLDYPVQGAMQWVSLYSERYGLYFGVHDPLPLYKRLEIGENVSGPFVLWRFADLALVRGETVTLPPVVLAIHGGGWRGGAQLYGAWASSRMRQVVSPPQVVRHPSWTWVGMKGQHASHPWHTAADLPSISQTAAQSGVDLVQVTAYTEGGHDTLYPDYVPGASVGGLAGFRQAIQTIHKAGRRVSLYTNGRIVDPAGSLTKAQRAAWAVRSAPDAMPTTETYGEVTFDVMCPGAEGWRDVFLDRLSSLARKLSVDGIYIDQVCGCRSLPCYATNHDHRRPNEAWTAYRGFMADLRACLTEINPGVFLATEGVNDFLGESFDLMQAHNDWAGPLAGRGIPLPSLFRTVFPGRILNAGCIRDDDAGLAYTRLAHVAGGGCDFGVADWSRVSPALAHEVAFVLEWRARYADVLDAGTIAPTRGPAGTWAQSFSVPGRIVVSGGVPGQQAASASDDEVELVVPLSHGGRVVDARASTAGGPTPVTWRQEDKIVRLQLGRSSIFGCVLTQSRAD